MTLESTGTTGDDLYVLYLGKLINNLQVLEHHLRDFLWSRVKGASERPFDELVMNEELDEDPMTNFDTLGKLIGKYNAVVEQVERAFVVSPDLEDLRDALAHGRVASTHSDGPYRLVKYTRPSKGKVRVEFLAIMDEQWLQARYREVAAAIGRVKNAQAALP